MLYHINVFDYFTTNYCINFFGSTIGSGKPNDIWYIWQRGYLPNTIFQLRFITVRFINKNSITLGGSPSLIKHFQMGCAQYFFLEPLEKANLAKLGDWRSKGSVRQMFIIWVLLLYIYFFFCIFNEYENIY